MEPPNLLAVSLSHLMRSAAGGPLAALCNGLLCWAGMYVEALTRVQLQAPPGDEAHPELLQGPGIEYEGWCHSKSGRCLQQVKTGSSKGKKS